MLFILIPTTLFSQETHQKTEEELHRITAKDRSITAIWLGVDPNFENKGYDFPLTFGVTKLIFKFGNKNRPYVFQPKGELYFDDWSFNIFSPDYRFVVLLQDHFGPYHIIPIENLRGYLAGKNVRFDIADGQTPGGSATIHGQINWISTDKMEFSAMCCGGGYMVTHKIDGKTKRGKWKAGERHLR